MKRARRHSVSDLATLLEAAYDVDRDADSWLAGLVATASATLDLGCGVSGMLYELTGDGVQLKSIRGAGVSQAWLEEGRRMHAAPELRAFVKDTYQNVLAQPRSFDMTNVEAQARLDVSFEPFGMRDLWLINGLDSSGLGCALHIFSSRTLRISERERGFLACAATHLATARRLQARLSASREARPEVEAIYDPQGRLGHAIGKARERAARTDLASAVRARERARTRGRHVSQLAVEGFRGLIAARWTLVDQFETDGRRFVVAVENVPRPRAPAPLSRREREVACLAALGRSNKLIAYELGLAHSTVRVLVARAAEKLGARNREELIERLRREGSTLGS